MSRGNLKEKTSEFFRNSEVFLNILGKKKRIYARSKPKSWACRKI